MGNEIVEKKIKRLFDFQRFMGNTGLQEVIDETKSGSGDVFKLSEYELDMVAGGSGQDTHGVRIPDQN